MRLPPNAGPFIGILICIVSTVMVPIAAASTAAAESAARSVQRPKICLVLSGGGARGAAHVGVLKVLEEYRVPIDCITGTSMGALVGASYASGMSVAEMEQINKEITTELLFKEEPPRQELSMRRKRDDYGIFFGPELGVGPRGVTLAKGLVTGVQLETVLRRLSKAKGFQRFDELNIPFRAVATDLVTGKPVIFTEGDLANVMRASMSVPGAVAPAELDGMMLVDGMLTANLPVEIAREMGADIIIAVNVGTPLLKREQLDGILGVTSQMLSILTEQNVQKSLESLRPGDILITPDLGDFTTGDFDHLPKIAPLGEAAAREVAERLARLSMPAAEYAELRRRQQIATEPDLRPVDEIRFGQAGRVNPRSIEAVMDTRAGEPIDQPTLDRDMRRIYGLGNFEHVNYRFLEEPGRRILVVDAVEKSWGLDTVRFGLGLSTDFEGDAHFNLIASYRKRWINALGAEWRTDLQVGRTSALVTELYQPLTPEGYFFVSPVLGIERRTADLYQGHQRVANYDITSTTAGFDIGALIGHYGELRLGIRGGVLDPKLDTGPQALSPGDGRVNTGGYTARLVLDQVDSVHFPRSGWRYGLGVFRSTGQLGADVEYAKWDSDGNVALSLGEYTVNLALKFGGKIGDDRLPRYDLFQWGGFLQQSGYATGQLLGDSLKYARIALYRRILRGTLLDGAYGGAAIEFGKVGNPLVRGSPEGTLKSAALFVAVDSPVGPVYLGYGRAEDGNSSWYFYLGKQF